MLQFLPMLMQGMQSVGGASQGGSGGMNGFASMLGASGGQGKSSKDIGMQFANAGLQLPNTPTAQQMVGQLAPNTNQQTMQRSAPSTFNPLIQMLMNGSR